MDDKELREKLNRHYHNGQTDPAGVFKAQHTDQALEAIEAKIVEARIDEVKKVLPSVGIRGDVNADRTITVEELWSAMVKRKKELELKKEKH